MTRLCGLLLLLASAAHAQTTIFVDCTNPSCPGSGSMADPYCKIQDAILAAASGDVIEVAACSYVESIDFLGKAIQVRSASGAALTTIDGNGAGSVVSFQSGEDGSSVLEGFTITNGSACAEAGVYCFNSSPTILSSTITANSSPGPFPCGKGGGIYAGLSSAPTIVDSTISGNSAYYAGGGFNSYLSAGATFENTTITGNSALFGGGLALQNDVFGTASVRHTIIDGNTSTYVGGGMAVLNSQVRIESSTLSGNMSRGGGGGVDLASTADVQIVNSILRNNATTGTGGGAASCFGIPGQKLTLTNSTLSGKAAGAGSGGVYSYKYSYGATVTIRNSILWNDTPAELIISRGDTVTVEYCDVQGGYAGLGNINADPLFVDPASGQLELQCGSPCIDAGPVLPPASLPPFDHSGLDARILGTLDIGADERGHDWALNGAPIAGGPPISLTSRAPVSLNGLLAEVLLSSSDGADQGGIWVPSSGGRYMGLAQDQTLTLWCSLPAAFRGVTLQGCSGVSTQPLSIPVAVPVGTALYTSGLAWDLTTGTVLSIAKTRSFTVQ